MEQEEIIKRLAEWAEEESRKVKALDEFKNSKVHLNLKSRIAKKECVMNDGQWERFKKVWESYGVKFTHDDGTYKSAYEIFKEMSQVWKDLSDDEKEKVKMHKNGAKSFKKKRAKRKMAKKSKRKNR